LCGARVDELLALTLRDASADNLSTLSDTSTDDLSALGHAAADSLERVAEGTSLHSDLGLSRLLWSVDRLLAVEVEWALTFDVAHSVEWS